MTYQKEWGPEDKIGGGDDHVHLDPGDALCLQVSDVLLYLDTLRRGDGQKVLTVLRVQTNVEQKVKQTRNNKSLCVQLTFLFLFSSSALYSNMRWSNWSSLPVSQF